MVWARWLPLPVTIEGSGGPREPSVPETGGGDSPAGQDCGGSQPVPSGRLSEDAGELGHLDSARACAHVICRVGMSVMGVGVHRGSWEELAQRNWGSPDVLP